MSNNSHRFTSDYMFKVLLVGDSGVGKSCLITRFADDTFNASFLSTIGVDFKVRNLQVEGKNVKLSVWDTAGQERFRNIIAGYYRGADAVLVAYDVNDETSFNNAKYWLDEVNRHMQDKEGTRRGFKLVKALVGTKLDRRDKDMGDKETKIHNAAKKFAEKEGMLFFETSSKTAENVDNLFYGLAAELKNQRIAVLGAHPTDKDRLVLDDTIKVDDGRSCMC